MRVQHPPPRPLLIWDGDCHFCGMWIARWRDETGDALDYAKSQEVAKNFPEIASSVFENSVVLITPEGAAYRGADAVFHAREFAGQHWPRAFYQKLRAFAALTEFAYATVAKHRQIASAITRMFWGDDVRRPTYFAARRIFLRALGLIYLIAFVSLWTQIDGLVGARGILPARDFLDAVREQYGASAFWLLPSACWFNASDAMLHALCAVGVIASAILVIGLVPIPALLICFASYLSLAIAGQSFLSFQWDILLLETGFLAIFLAPWRWRLSKSDPPPSTIALFLLKFLLFKLMFMSGVVKLTSGDDCWWKLTALDWHYWTQPL
nr:lipase maturation factor family protein [Verrucomicrobiota bacterium]